MVFQRQTFKLKKTQMKVCDTGNELSLSNGKENTNIATMSTVPKYKGGEWKQWHKKERKKEGLEGWLSG